MEKAIENALSGGWVSMRDIVAYTRLSRATIGNRLAAARRGEDNFPLPFRVGGRVLWTRASIREWMARVERESLAEAA